MTASLVSVPLSPIETMSYNSNVDAMYFENLAQEASVPIFSWSDIPCQSSFGNDLYFYEEPIESMDEKKNNFYLNIRHVESYVPLSESLENKFNRRIRQEADITSDTCQPDMLGMSKKSRKSGKSVSFSTALKMRTYSIVVGEHPFCREGMAIECGWEYNESEPVDLDMKEKQNVRRRGNVKRQPKSFHLNFSARRDRLQQVTGLTPFELMEEEYRVVSNDNEVAPLQAVRHAPKLFGLSSMSR